MILHLEDPRIKELCSSDPRLGALIARLGALTISLERDPFESLVRSIISQQISVKAAATIRERVRRLAGVFTPQALHALEDETLRGAGLSASKTAYLRDLSSKLLSGELDFTAFPEMDNEAVIAALTSVKGIGRWTAEMFLMFVLGRENVISFGDAGLQRAALWLYDLETRKDKKYLQQIAHYWPSYGSYVCLYLWEAINQELVDSGKSFGELILEVHPDRDNEIREASDE
ncbi:DNA-3-methyladenine glycosylase family protein [Paenibacillus physcomitrellae]|uniref:DNA-3-methyladenine glycosylase II n=1 Tax=Paenibacillus physcomitrellae TaxID=1619311 RepID=A0ABQ1GEW6_9BACL|nr:DNA-3-methyladenine glycosylase [Paenibacillus physcomitrellae]GGA42500.1 DNA-3-methyladenine glycosylase II [Paenibacillus physcomitrellae]